MTSIKQHIKDFMYSRNAPESLARWYFGKKEQKHRNRLGHLLSTNGDLMQAVQADQRPHWQERIDRVLNSADNAGIERVANAGKIIDGELVMHNGIKVDPLSYYSFPLLKMLIDNKGVHEPQEEKIFQEALKTLDSSKQLTMVELGAYWAFYSMWLLQQFPNSRCVMVEPDRQNLLYGKRNFKANGMSGTFIHAGIGAVPRKNVNTTTVEAICRQQGIHFLDILHSDIQGYELEMLQGAKSLFDSKRVGYAFISTHSNELHRDCRQFLLDYDFIEIASVTPEQSSSWDGVLVLRAPHYPGLDSVEVEKIEKGRG